MSLFALKPNWLLHARPNEKDGVDYFYISEENFKEKIKENAFLEWAQVHKNYYGTAISTIGAIQNDGHNILLEIDVQGVDTLRNMNFDGVFILILPPSIQELENRLRKRSTEAEEKIQARIEVGKFEITQYRLYDYVVTNHEVENTVKNILTIMKSEENRAARYVPESKDIADILGNQKAKF